MMKKSSTWCVGIVLTTTLSLGLMSFTGRDDKNFEIAKNLDIFYTLFREVNMYYVDSVPTEKIIHDGIDKMLSDLDPYTNYIPEEDMADFKFMTTGEYGGIGAMIQYRDSFVSIAEPYLGLPAQKAGLKAGDKILALDGESMRGKTTSQVSDKLKGTPNTSFEITIERYGVKKPMKFMITRENVVINPVPYYGILDSTHVGYIILTSFTDKAGAEVKKALLDLKAKGAQSIVLDLRGNPGGILGEAVKICNLFIPKGREVVSTRGKIRELDESYKTQEAPVDTTIPLVILVSQGSASASEIVTGTMQDYDRAVIVGNRTFGKGLVQSTRNLAYNAKLKVTTAKYYIPSGRCIQALDYTHRNKDGSVGVVPDSLMKDFKTRNGRLVKDGGGILPDTIVKYTEAGAIMYDLVRKYAFYDYATIYAFNHTSIPPVKDFKLTDADYEDFKAYLKKTKFEYKPQSLTLLDKMEKTSKEERSYDRSKALFDQLKVSLSHDLDKDLDLFKPEIIDFLSSAIVSRYYYEAGRMEQNLKGEEGIAVAKSILANPVEYNNFLKPKK